MEDKLTGIFVLSVFAFLIVLLIWVLIDSSWTILQVILVLSCANLAVTIFLLITGFKIKQDMSFLRTEMHKRALEFSMIRKRLHTILMDLKMLK